jgi:beta-xylosidase
MKKTAVEWLRDLYENQPAYDEFILDEQWENAIEMEKEQMIDFAAYCIEHYGDKKVRKMGLYEMFDEYNKLPF